MLNRTQKGERLKQGEELLEKNKSLIFVDFTGIGVEDMKSLRRALKTVEAKIKIIKKKLLRIAFEKKKIDFNPEQFDSQLGVVFSEKEISDVAGPVYKFFKGVEKKGFKILGAYNLSEKNFFDAATTLKIGQLPSREVLLGQFVGMLAMPIKMFMNVLEQKSKLVDVK
ncbi:MAG: 50S ribosomal protein L10 [Spirochaetia bacterium]|nr:MAG: 50S ribosomal protein L10 [Spirochaetia bacterium]